MSRNKKGRNSSQNIAKNAAGKEQTEKSVPKAAEKETAVVETAVKTEEVAQKVAEQEPPALKNSSEVEEPGIGFLQNVKEHVLSANPVFIKAVALVPILGAATTLKNGVMLSGTMLLTVVLLNLLMYPFHRIIPHSYRFAASFLAAGVAITPVYMLAKYLAPTVAAQCSLYLPLIAVCALPLIEKKHYGKKFGIVKTALDAALDGVGFAFAAILVSIIREIAGYGTLYDRTLPYVSRIKFSFAAMPVGALVLLGLLLALFRKIYGTNDDGGGNKN